MKQRPKHRTRFGLGRELTPFGSKLYARRRAQAKRAKAARKVNR